MDVLPLQGRRILVAPLDWGLGHATRCMPVINMLRRYGAEVIIGGEGRSLLLLKAAYPDLEFVDLPPYNITYSHNSLMVWKTLVDTPRLLGVFKEEHEVLHELVDKHSLHAVLSDNRYGLWTDKVPSVFMCHQLAVIMPAILSWTRRNVYRLHLKYISKYKYLWIPDHQGGQSLSGELTNKYPLPEYARFIGPLSRFDTIESHGEKSIDNLVLVLLSGPEPQRSLLENQIIQQAEKDKGRKYIIVRGVTDERSSDDIGDHISRYNFLDGQELLTFLQQAEVVVARSGYSTIMDLSILGKKALFIPTPGQTEQEYLAATLSGKGYVATQSQNSIDLVKGVGEALSLPGLPHISTDPAALRNAMAEWLGTSLG